MKLLRQLHTAKQSRKQACADVCRCPVFLSLRRNKHLHQVTLGIPHMLYRPLTFVCNLHVWIFQEPMLGKFEFCSKKNERMGSAHKARCLAHMFVMDVHEELDEWPESHERKRLWVCQLRTRLILTCLC